MADVAICGVTHAADPANGPAFRARRFSAFAEHNFFNRDLGLVVELAAIAVNKLDAVVLKWVVRGAHDNAKAGPGLSGKHGDGRCRHHAGEDDIDSGRVESGDEG